MHQWRLISFYSRCMGYSAGTDIWNSYQHLYERSVCELFWDPRMVPPKKKGNLELRRETIFYSFFCSTCSAKGHVNGMVLVAGGSKVSIFEGSKMTCPSLLCLSQMAALALPVYSSRTSWVGGTTGVLLPYESSWTTGVLLPYELSGLPVCSSRMSGVGTMTGYFTAFAIEYPVMGECIQSPASPPRIRRCFGRIAPRYPGDSWLDST